MTPSDPPRPVRRYRGLLAAFGVLAAGSIVLTGTFDYLLAPDRRELVVTMDQDAGQPARLAVKQACGSLPGISVVPDRGNPSPEVQGRFPVRFALKGATAIQEAALETCIQRQGHVRGFLIEGDR